MDRPIRVLIADPFKLMREALIDTFAGQPDIEVIGEVSEDSDLPRRVQETRPDFVFIGLDSSGVRPRVCDTVLRLYPDVNVIGIAVHSNYSVRYWSSNVIHSTVMECSEEAILAALRGKTALKGETCEDHVN